MRLWFLICVFCLAPVTVFAQGLSIIRDTEIETAMRLWATPVLKAANLSPDQVSIIVVNDSTVNAFVAGGANIFMFAGLIEKADFVDEVIGVMAHEIGHITGGHLIASRRAIERASYQSILSTIIGVGAAVLSGDGRAAGAISAGGAGLATSGFLSHSRAQESAADQAALTYMERAKMSPEGLVTFMRKLEGQELLPASQQSEYMRTHPLTRDRIEAMQNGLNHSPHADNHASEADQKLFNRMKAKLIAFRTPQNVPRFYDLSSGTEDARYAHAIMNYRQSKFDEANALFDDLTRDYPQSPFYYEMKAQNLRDSGNLADAEKNYRTALKKLNGHAPLIQTSLAHILIEQGKNLSEAEDLLLKALRSDRRETRIYRLLATIEGRRGNEEEARYYLAEEAAAQGRLDDARGLLALALRDNQLDSTVAVKANDLKIYLDGLPNRDE
jgi:predicted Zn-dependent protease